MAEREWGIVTVHDEEGNVVYQTGPVTLKIKDESEEYQINYIELNRKVEEMGIILKRLVKEMAEIKYRV